MLLAPGDLVEQDVGLGRLERRPRAGPRGTPSSRCPPGEGRRRCMASSRAASRCARSCGARQRVRHLEAPPLHQRLDERVLHVAVDAALLRRRQLAADALRAGRPASPNSPRSFANSSSSRRHHLGLDGLDADGVVDRLAGAGFSDGWSAGVDEPRRPCVSPGLMPSSAAFRSSWLSADPTSTSTFSSVLRLAARVRVGDVEHDEVAVRARRVLRRGRTARPRRAGGRAPRPRSSSDTCGPLHLRRQPLVVGTSHERQRLEHRAEGHRLVLVDLELGDLRRSRAAAGRGPRAPPRPRGSRSLPPRPPGSAAGSAS